MKTTWPNRDGTKARLKVVFKGLECWFRFAEEMNPSAQSIASHRTVPPFKLAMIVG